MQSIQHASANQAPAHDCCRMLAVLALHSATNAALLAAVGPNYLAFGAAYSLSRLYYFALQARCAACWAPALVSRVALPGHTSHLRTPIPKSSSRAGAAAQVAYIWHAGLGPHVWGEAPHRAALAGWREFAAIAYPSAAMRCMESVCYSGAR